jgi:processive 1,2-diacylglycerol beta-glucosyltransferase
VDRAATLAQYNLRPEVPIILISAGAAGITSATIAVEQLLRLENDFQAVVVCGRNDRLRREIVALAAPRASNFRVLGYSERMPDLLRVATLFVGKPGGLAASECMAAGLPMVIIEPIPGQEERNSHHLLEEGAAVRCSELSTIKYKVDRLLADPARLARMSAAARAFGRPDAAEVIVETLLRECMPAMQIATPTRPSFVGAILGEPAPATPAAITLFEDETGVLLGTLSEAQFQFLADHLEQESTRDDDYFINQATVELLASRGADAKLLGILRAALRERAEAEIRWVRSDPMPAAVPPTLQVEPSDHDPAIDSGLHPSTGA